MRTTRAALRAQEAEEELQSQVDGKLREQGSYTFNEHGSAEPLIYEDDSIEDSGNLALRDANAEAIDEGRKVLRDITDENYPMISTVAFDDSGELKTKTSKKAKCKRGKRAVKKDVVVEETRVESPEEAPEGPKEVDLSTTADTTATIEEPVDTVEIEAESPALSNSLNEEVEALSQNEPTIADTEDVSQDLEVVAEPSVSNEADVSESNVDNLPQTPPKSNVAISKTPKFNPDIHLATTQSSTIVSDSVDDSFVDTILTRSPSKHSQTMGQPQEQATTPPLAEAFVSCTPSKSPVKSVSSSPQRIEDSVEAIDALEDAIEKFAEDLPILEALPFESPVKSRKTPVRATTKTPAKTPAKTPLKASLQAVEKTPVRTSAKTPAKVATHQPRAASLDKTHTNTPRALKERLASTKRETVKERVKAIESGSTPISHRRATSVHVLRKEAPEVKQTLKSRHMATKSFSSLEPSAGTSMSFSNSPVKQATNQPKKRVTSGGVLVTSKPGFVPAKSSKPATTSTFALPGEAIAAKLKAQREERLKREESEAEKKTAFKARPAPVRTARPSVMPRENKASTARMSVRQASGENKENVAPAQSTSTSATSKTTPSSTSRPATGVAAANSSARRTTVAPKSTSMVESKKSIQPTTIAPQTSQRIASLTAGEQVTLTKAETAQQKLKGKEVYSRIKSSIQQQEEERKAKEEAARKARAEAAERGRQASREWAEKQKKKLNAGGGNGSSAAKTVTVS